MLPSFISLSAHQKDFFDWQLIALSDNLSVYAKSEDC